jgi:hypothetical protein
LDRREHLFREQPHRLGDRALWHSRPLNPADEVIGAEAIDVISEDLNAGLRRAKDEATTGRQLLELAAQRVAPR